MVFKGVFGDDKSERVTASLICEISLAARHVAGGERSCSSICSILSMASQGCDAGILRASLYTCPRFLNPRATGTTPQGEVFDLGEVDTVKVHLGEHRQPCSGGENCDTNWREENTCKLKIMISPHRRYHVERGGNPTSKFSFNPRLIENKKAFFLALRILCQKERDWMSIHPNAEPYPHTTSLFYDTCEEDQLISSHPNVQPISFARSPNV